MLHLRNGGCLAAAFLFQYAFYHIARRSVGTKVTEAVHSMTLYEWHQIVSSFVSTMPIWNLISDFLSMHLSGEKMYMIP
jgi:hypothetical protein